MEPENLQSVLMEAGIQVDMKNLQNPSEDFLIYLITEYLNKFNFDGNKICKSTPEQLDCVSCPDSTSDAIKVINLYSALSSVCNEIFLKDFCLTDITSPGPKRARRQIKILFNFFAYVRNKMVENEMAFVDLDNQQKNIEEMIDNKNSIIAKIGATINDREVKSELKQRLQQEIEQISAIMENNEKVSKELEYRVKDVMVQHQDAYKNCSDLKSKAVQLHKVTTELQSKIVKSPEEYAARSKELNKVLEIKREERQILNDSISRKKLQIKNNENAQELVKDLNQKFSANANETCKKLKETSEKLEYVQKELDILKTEISKWTSIDTNNTNSVTKIEDVNGHKELLYELDNQYAEKEREYKAIREKLEELKSEESQVKNMLQKESETILLTEHNYVKILNDYKTHFEDEISEEMNLRKYIKQMPK